LSRIGYLKLSVIALVAAVVMLAGVSPIVSSHLESKQALNAINKNLDAEGLQIGMPESRIKELWGQGDYGEGFGGHFRHYSERDCTIGIAGDKDNSFYSAVSTIEFTNQDFRLFGYGAGDSVDDMVSKLDSLGFKSMKNNNEIMVKGEYSIAILGVSQIERIQIWFNDKDLKDRLY